MSPVLASVVFPGQRATSDWAWVLLCVSFFALPLVMLAFGLHSHLTGKPVPGLASEEEEEAQDLPYTIEEATSESWAYGLGSLALALATAAFGLWRSRIPQAFRRSASRLLDPPLVVLKGAHSGVIGDYVFWIVIGTGVVGTIWAISLR
jgi:hypothetical protein